MLRVTGGKYRGANLYCPRNIRPTSGRIKEYIFAKIGDAVENAKTLDLFAGSGALGIEALSRGAETAVFVDIARAAIEALHRNLTKLGIQAPIVRKDAFKFIAAYKNAPFDLILADPPYTKFNPADILKAVEESKLLNPAGLLVIEMASNSVPPQSESFALESFKKLGDTAVGVWRKT